MPLTCGYESADAVPVRVSEISSMVDAPGRGHQWDTPASVRERDHTASGIVTGWNRGGLLVRRDEPRGLFLFHS
jgi:hypothetical protein